MKFMILFKTIRDREVDMPPCKDLPKMIGFIEELSKSGVLLATEGLHPSSRNGVRVRRAEGKFTITDGPFAEAKELVAGFALVKAMSKQEAIELSKQFLEIAGEGTAEVREVIEQS